MDSVVLGTLVYLDWPAVATLDDSLLKVQRHMCCPIKISWIN